MATGVRNEVVDQRLAEPPATRLGAHVHALELSVLASHQQDPAASGGLALVSQHEERDALRDQFLDAEPVAALRWVERLEVRLELVDELDRASGVSGRSATIVTGMLGILR